MKLLNQKLKNILQAVNQRSRFVQGLAIGLGITSMLTYAVTNITIAPILSGDPLSAAVVTAKFTQVQSAMNELLVRNSGFTAYLSSNFTVACVGTKSPTYPTDFTAVSSLSFDWNDSNFSGSTYTIPATGSYEIFVEAPIVSFESAMVYIDIDAGASTDSLNGTYRKVKRFNVGQQIRLLFGCGSKGGADILIDSTGFVFGIKKM